jgi:molybdate transport system regulatory protein
MKVSARNTLAGKVTKITTGAVNSEVDLSLANGDKVAAIITNESVASLGLKEGSSAVAMIKASEVIIGKGLQQAKISARNLLSGKVVKVQDGSVNSEVVLKLSGGSEVVAIITKESVHSLGLKEGDEAQAIVKASNIIIAVD